ncbi:hypothetical protein L345_05471, partial [Ophiophagus hannah]
MRRMRDGVCSSTKPGKMFLLHHQFMNGTLVPTFPLSNLDASRITTPQLLACLEEEERSMGDVVCSSTQPGNAFLLRR